MLKLSAQVHLSHLFIDGVALLFVDGLADLLVDGVLDSAALLLLDSLTDLLVDCVALLLLDCGALNRNKISISLSCIFSQLHFLIFISSGKLSEVILSGSYFAFVLKGL